MTPTPPHYFMSPVARFKKIATVAATRVETMRDLLVNWNFFIETKVVSCRSWPICVNFWEQKCHLSLFACCLLHTCPRCSCSGRSRTSCWDSEGYVLSWETSWVVPPGRDWLCPWSSQSKSFLFNHPDLFEIADEPDFEHNFSKVTFSNSVCTTMGDHSHPTKVLLCFLHMAEQVVAKPPRPSDVTHRWSLYYLHSVTSFDILINIMKTRSDHKDSSKEHRFLIASITILIKTATGHQDYVYNPWKSLCSTELAKLFNQFSALVELARWDYHINSTLKVKNIRIGGIW